MQVRLFRADAVQRYAPRVVIVVMGAAGAGKSTVGRALADAVGFRFVEGDDYHSAAAIASMRAGIALTDGDRWPWLAALHGVIATAVERREPVVVACSALHERYRDTLRGDLRGVRFVYLKADAATLRQRLTARTEHFAGPALVASQLAALEEPADAFTVDATRPVAEIVNVVRYEFGL
jgi:gluconokinase